ncbi:hypothetical protein KL942_002181 [Ogataea angusta]|uniref:Flavin reductase like domain-containing protein n=1 Tax=Pichia angusta TaxID=870730 RepID=A0ABQ7RR31_PICAN|nr:hypothetical protein KL942_002181 [Ogataea angusta]KAG7846035.1 hypothetical protein KL940_004622 [Ogataea angusta]
MSLSPFENADFKLTSVPDPNWQLGSGATNNEWAKYKKVELDPYAEGRLPFENYKLLVSAITPRPIGFISTVGKDGTRNLSPFSYFNVMNHDPPVFTIGISGATGNLKDTCKNLQDTQECTINLISEWFIEAANYTCINAPYDVDEWKLAGLTPAKSSKVKPPHVAESAFSIEGKLIHTHHFKSKRDPSKGSGTTLLVEGVNFHIREDIADEKFTTVDINKLKPVARLGGNVYTRVLQGFDIPRPDFKSEISEHPEVSKLL